MKPDITIARICSSGVAGVAASRGFWASERTFAVWMLITESVEWTAEVYGEPHTGSETLLSSRSSTDRTCAVDFAGVITGSVAQRGQIVNLQARKSRSVR